MKELYQSDPKGCLLWCAFMFGCPVLGFLTIIIQDGTGFHLQNVEWFQSIMEVIVYGIWIVGGGYVLIKLFTSDDDSGGGASSTLDRGAGTMSWDDSGDGGSE